MNEYLQLYDLMSYFGIKSKEAFASYYNELLAPLENQNLDMEGFEWAPTQIDFDYRVWETGDNIEIMATYVDIDSEATPIGGEVDFKEYTGTIPTHKAFVTLDQTDYRKKLVFLNNLAASASLTGGNASVSVREHLEEYLFTKLSAIPNAHKGTLNYQVGQMKSKGALTLTDQNNPRGGYANATFSAKIPAANFITKKWWTKKWDGTIVYDETADPLMDIKKEIRNIKKAPQNTYSYSDIKLEMLATFFEDLMGHPSWKKHIGYALMPNLLIAPDNDSNAMAVGANYLMEQTETNVLIGMFKRLTGATDVKLDYAVAGVEYYDTTKKKLVREKLNCFEYGTILFRPTGNIGKIIPVAAFRPDSRAITNTIFGGRGLVEYIYDEDKKVQKWRSELTCLAVPTVPRRLRYMKVVEFEPEPVYTAVSNPSGNPKTKGYYEKVGDSYVLTSDTTVTEGKTYYTKS